MKTISYCIPVMNRSNDIEATLNENLKILKEFQNETEIIINCFDEDDNLSNYIHQEFRHEIEDGLLTFNNVKKLKHWHFCWAKNSFKSTISSKYYASLDGDNFITRDEVKSTLDICKSVDNALIHLFSGRWGDGTSGRVVIPANLYIKHGYFDELYPRQFDEMALILSILTFEKVDFYSRIGVNIFDLSGYARLFKEKQLEGTINHIQCEFGEVISPLMPRGDGYAKVDDKLSTYQNINAYYAMAKIATTDNARSFFSKNLINEQDKVISKNLSSIIYSSSFIQPTSLPSKSNETTLFAVIKNDFQYLKPWYKHYKEIGINRFIIIDDNSSTELSEFLPYDDVFVFKPIVGNFKMFKTFWIRILAQMYQKEQSWILTVDSDEFLDISAGGFASISELIEKCEKINKDYCGGVLIEMLPSEKKDVSEANFLTTMDHHLWRPKNSDYGYQNIPSIKWAFGTQWAKSFEFDFRYRFYGTIDCLRKFPLIKFNNQVSLNQGFHTLIHNKIELNSEDFNHGDLIKIPIKHYKFQKLIGNAEFEKLKSTDINGYFGRTKANIDCIIKTDESISVGLFYSSIHKKYYSGAKIFQRLNEIEG